LAVAVISVAAYIWLMSIIARWGVLLGMLGSFWTAIAVTACRRGVASALTLMGLIAVAQPLLFWIALGFQEAVIGPSHLGELSIFEKATDVTIDFLHLGTLAASGPFGIPVTLKMDFNFPADRHWSYLLALSAVILVQWTVVWFVGRLLVESRHPVAGFIALFAGVGIVFGSAFFLQMVNFVLNHTLNKFASKLAKTRDHPGWR